MCYSCKREIVADMDKLIKKYGPNALAVDVISRAKCKDCGGSVHLHVSCKDARKAKM